MNNNNLNSSINSFYTVKEVASLLPVTQRTVYRLIESGELASIKIRGKILIKREDFEQFFRKLNENTTSEKTEETGEKG